jgi:hypothetical protein
VPILAWRNDADGYAFANGFEFDATERAYLDGLAQPAIWETIAIVAAVAGPVAALAVGAAAEAYVLLGSTPTYGLCGGMAYSSLDHWRAKVPLPRGAQGDDRPTRTSAAPTLVRQMLWDRLIDSLVGGGVLTRTLEWSLILNQVPEPFGGAPELLRRTLEEWERVRAHIDAGEPWPLGLIYTNRSVWDQHQVVAYGYEVTGPGSGKLYVYDSNAPHMYGQATQYTGMCGDHNSEITLNFRGRALSGTSPSDNVTYLDNCATRLQLDTLAGFFCSDYRPVPPPVGLAKSFGQFLNWNKEEGEEEQIWMVTDGTRLPVAGSEELAALGAVPDDVRHPDELKWTGTLPPRDGALFRELRSDAVFLYAGGAPFHVPDPTSLESFGGEGAVRTVPAETLQTLARPPREGTLLRELSDSKVFLIEAGKRRWLSTRIERAKHGGAASVRVVPDGALTSIPQGPDLPPGGPTTTVPDVREMLKPNATADVLAADLVPEFIGPFPAGPNPWVWSQSPMGDSIVERGSTVTMQLRTGPIP